MSRISVANLRRSLADMIHRVRLNNHIFVVYWHGRPSAVIIPYDQAVRMNIVQNAE
jgi:antitoxin (DNA-binding transcriptional repressor) of toxin-antitoxin stability system